MLNAFNGRGRSLRSLDKEKERKLNKRRFTGQTSLQVGFSTPTFVGADSFFLTLTLSLSLSSFDCFGSNRLVDGHWEFLNNMLPGCEPLIYPSPLNHF